MSNYTQIQLDEIDKTVRKYIVLAAPTKEIAEELLEWWENNE